MAGPGDEYVKRWGFTEAPSIGLRPQLDGRMFCNDELVFDTPQFSPQRELDFITGVSSIMERAGSTLGIITPVSVSRTLTNWHDAEEITIDQLRSALSTSA